MKRLKIFFAAGLLMASFSSCKKDFLDLKPYNALPLADAGSNEANLQTLVNGMYSTLRNIQIYGRTIPVKGDLMADNTWVKANNSGRYLDFNDYNITVPNTNVSDIWTGLYITIKNANLIINSTLAANANVNQFKGEAYAVRALAYFDLMRNFAKPYSLDPTGYGVPIITSFDQNALPLRNKQQEVYKLITDDLNQAYSLMTLNLNGSMTLAGTGTVRSMNSSYFTKYGARALQAKVYLYMGDYANAKAAALDVVTNSGITLVSSANYVSYWKNPTPISTRVETIFEVTNDNGNNNGTNALAYMYDPNGYGDIVATTDIVSKYRPADVRLGVIVPGTSAGVAVNIVNKYSNTTNANEKDDIKILRYADVVLILAEAHARTGEDGNALIRLNQVAQTREPGFAGYTSSGSQLIDDIILERRKELAFEGDRFFDLNRLNLAFTKTRREGPVVTIAVAAGDFRRVFPIPQAELDVNPNIRGQQNAGY